MASARKIKSAANEEVQLQLLYGDDARFKYWESHLFNEVYLRRDLPEKHADKWNNTEDLGFQHFMNTLRNLALEFKDSDKELSNWSETETINKWVKHVLDALGWKNNCNGVQDPFLEETSFRYDGKTYRTDILIVDHPKETKYINQAKGDDKLVEARNSVIMPVEVKYWQRLEEFRQGKKAEKKRNDNESDDLEKIATPNEQTVQYMDILKKNWGILTDGAKWRLFNSELSSEDSSRYYEFNLYSLVQSINTEETENDRSEVIEAAKYFYHFFSKDTFYSKDEGVESFVGEILRYSKKYVNQVEEDLKDRFVKAMNIVCNGIHKVAKANKQNADLATIRNVGESTLFNILFIKSLESRGVLPMNSTDYKKISLSNIIDKIERFDPVKDEALNNRELDRAFRKGNGNSFSYNPTGSELHDRIVRLTQVIHDGSSKDKFGFEISGFKDSVFLDAEWGIFKSCKLPNRDWVKIIFQIGYAESESLSRKHQQIPYSYFTPRQLGSIYESFLEFQIKQADESLVFEKKQWKSADLDSKKYKLADLPKVNKGELYFTPDNKDRKATGSYYTPHDIVRFIVSKTLGPLVTTASSKEILALRVCDPTMGSGHFLVEALNYLTAAYLAALTSESKGDIDITVPEAKQKVLDACIFGIDVNPRAVKLAKMSLWLESAQASRRLEDLRDQLINADTIKGAVKTLQSKANTFGFDAVVGNPPYVNLHWEEETKAYLRESKEYDPVKDLQGDLWYLILYKSVNLLKLNGRLGFVVSRYFLENTFATKLRKWLATHTSIEALLDFQDKHVFPGVNIHTAIVILSNTEASDNKRVEILDFEFQKQDEIEQVKLTEHKWALTSQVSSPLNVAKNMVPMKDLFDIYKGIVSGSNKAFIFEKSEVKRMSKEIQKYFKPVIRNSDLERSVLKKRKDLYLLYLAEPFPKDALPKELLDVLKDRMALLKNRTEIKQGQRAWYLLDRSRREFGIARKQNKIFVPYRAKSNKFYFDTDGHVAISDVTVISPKVDAPSWQLKALELLLNSNVYQTYFENHGKRKGGVIEYLPGEIESLLIPDFAKESAFYRKLADEFGKGAVNWDVLSAAVSKSSVKKKPAA
jgi:adenine-specific DNA-methyltransferase